MNKLLVVVLLPLFLVSACSVQKRKYQKGFYVSWRHASPGEKTTKSSNKVATRSPASSAPEAVSAVQEKQAPVYATADHNLQPDKPIKPQLLFQKDDPCDNLMFKDGSELNVKVIEINTTEIKYRKCETPDGPIYVVKKADIFMVKYANGTKEVFKADPAPVQQYDQTTPYRPYKGAQRVHPLAILSIIFGILGIYPIIGLASIVALLLANRALADITRQPDRYSGQAAARVGKVLGIVGLCLAVFYILLIVLVLLLLM